MEKRKKFADLKVGDTVWTTTTRIRNSDEVKLTEREVIKVGRKYVTVACKDRWRSESQYSMEDGYENVDSNYRTQLVRSPEAYFEERTRQKVWSAFSKNFRNYGCRLDDDVKTEDIIMAANLLKLELDLE
jgi:hypothetical protein